MAPDPTCAGSWKCFGTSKRLSLVKTGNTTRTRGTTQGGIIFTTLCNLIVDNVVRKFLALMVEDSMVTQEGPGLAVWRCLGFFYAYNGVVGLQGLEWLQGSLNLFSSAYSVGMYW